VGPKGKHKCSRKREAARDFTQTEEEAMMTAEAEIGTMRTQIKGCQQPPGRGKEQVFQLKPLKGVCPANLHFDFGLTQLLRG
jgi:hypothetical protein